MCADGQRIRNPRLFRGRVVLVAVGGILGVILALVFLMPMLMPRMIRRHLGRIRQNTTMMRVLKSYHHARSKTAGRRRSCTALLTHVGRRGTRTYQTPLGAYAYGDGFVLSLAFGSQTDWYRNVMAAGTCTLAWKGQTHQLERPEIISGPQVMRAWPAWERIALRGAGIHDFLWLHEKNAKAGLPSSDVTESPH